MKKQFYLHRINAPLEADHVVYHVWVGAAHREQSMLTRIVAWAFEVGATFMSWREDIDYYLQLESERVFSRRGLLDFGFVRIDLTAAECLQHIEANDWETIENKPSVTRSFIQSVCLNDPCRLDSAKGKIKNSTVSAEKCKNLSHISKTYKTNTISFI